MAPEKECKLFICKWTTLIAVGVCFELVLFLTMIFPYAGMYETWRRQRSPSITQKYTFEGPSAQVIAGHWVCFGFSFIFGLTFFCTRWELCGFITMITFVPEFVIGYCTYVGLFFTSDDYVWFDSYMTPDQVNALLVAAKSARPDLGFRATGKSEPSELTFGSSTCETKIVPLEVTYCEDVSPEFEVTRNDMLLLTGWRLKIEIKGEFLNESKENMDEIYEEGRWCVPYSWFYRNTRTVVSIPGLAEEIIVTPDGKPLPCIGRFHAVMSGLFLHGLSYAYRVALIPSVTVNIKKNLMFTYYNVSHICDDVGDCD